MKIANQDVRFFELVALDKGDGPVSEIIRKLASEWAEGDPSRLGPHGPRIGTVYAFRDEEGSLHIDFIPRHSASVEGFVPYPDRYRYDRRSV